MPRHHRENETGVSFSRCFSVACINLWLTSFYCAAAIASPITPITLIALAISTNAPQYDKYGQLLARELLNGLDLNPNCGANVRHISEALPAIGIVANPASGHDIRRLTSGAAVYSAADKVNSVERVLGALGATGVTRVLMMPDRAGIAVRLRRAVELNRRRGSVRWPRLDFIDMPVLEDARDTVRAVREMVARAIRCALSTVKVCSDVRAVLISMWRAAVDERARKRICCAVAAVAEFSEEWRRLLATEAVCGMLEGMLPELGDGQAPDFATSALKRIG